MIRAAASTIDLQGQVGAHSHNHTAAPFVAVHGALRTTVLLLRDEATSVCLVAPNLSAMAPGLYRTIQAAVAQGAGIEPHQVLVFSSHNHCAPPLSSERNWTTWGEVAECELTAFGQHFIADLSAAAARLPERLEPVSIHWAVGHEERISYNRKGYRADGSSYMIREEDRVLLGADFRGDIDDEASVVRLVGGDDRTVAWLAHFNAHPVTAYHPERPVVHPEFPGIACDLLAGEEGAPVVFLQGCAGDVNSKGLLTGDVARADQHGRWLGETYQGAASKLQAGRASDLAFARVVAKLPLAELPSPEALKAELAEIDDFLHRARSGDEDTLTCLGLNFPRALSPNYRAKLVEGPRQWSEWALAQHENGTTGQVPSVLPMEVCVLSLGDVGIVGMPCEPFTAIGRQIRAAAPMPLVLPCGYCNLSYGYVPDAGNVDGTEYMSAFYRYTRRPPYRSPAGSVLADTAVDASRRLGGHSEGGA